MVDLVWAPSASLPSFVLTNSDLAPRGEMPLLVATCSREF